jgi:superfamily I DNA/RNA helicase
MNECIAAALRKSQALRRDDLSEVERHVSEARIMFQAKPEAQRRRAAVVNALRPDGKVRGYTYQGIKGLQFKGVAVVDVAKDKLPHRNLADLWGDARRLYVGLTRTQAFLAVHAPNRNWDRSMFYPIVMGQQSSEAVIQTPLPESLRTLDQNA